MPKPIGLYLHIPFCLRKCPYCDFYSVPVGDELLNAYTARLCEALQQWGETLRRPADTCYFGGGTPSLLGAKRVARILHAAREAFGLSGAEVTLEANPATVDGESLRALREAGVNRLSIGLQSGVDAELKALGRPHSAEDAAETVRLAKDAGFDNLSLDLMLAIPGQTIETLRRSVSFCASLKPTHISAYLLKCEPDTAFGRQTPAGLPDEEGEQELYLTACELLEREGFLQYEISNFARPGQESRHNFRYWDGQEYLGLGPAAHSFVNGRRFCYPRDLQGFLGGNTPAEDGTGGDFEEYALLRLRLTEGLLEEGTKARFGHGLPEAMRRRTKPLEGAGLVWNREDGIGLTREGMLVSNAVIAKLLGW